MKIFTYFLFKYFKTTLFVEQPPATPGLLNIPSIWGYIEMVNFQFIPLRNGITPCSSVIQCIAQHCRYPLHSALHSTENIYCTADTHWSALPSTADTQCNALHSTADTQHCKCPKFCRYPVYCPTLQIPIVMHTVRSLAPICSSTTITMFSELCFKQTHTARRRLIQRKDYNVQF